MNNSLVTTPKGTSGPIASSYDVVIVGARAAGASLAMLLARRGISVLAVDRSAHGSDTLSTHSLSRSAVLLLSRWGLLDELRAADTPVTTTLTFRYGGEPLDLDVSGPGPVDGLYSPRRTVLDATLVDEATRSGATIRHGVSVVGLTRGATGRVDGVDLSCDGERRRVRARWVIGADGTNSRVAAQVQAPMIRQEQSTSAVIYSFFRGLDPHRIENHFEQAGTAFGVIPTNDGEANVWVAMHPDRFAAEARGDLGGAFARTIASSPAMTAALEGCEQVGGFRGFPGLPGYLRQAHGRGWALVGDAGYFKDPVSAHGITDAFIGAELLAAAVDRVISDGADEHESFARYQQLRDQVAEPMMEPVASLATMTLDGAEAGAAFLGMSAALKEEWAFLHTDAVATHAPPVAAVATR